MGCRKIQLKLVVLLTLVFDTLSNPLPLQNKTNFINDLEVTFNDGKETENTMVSSNVGDQFRL